jgi:metal-responsive CopG/Arc/MetJ family transcriptional regulator
MKTAISIPDDLFATAEQLAARCGMSRSELYVTALRDYIAAHHYDRVTERLNAIYDEVPSTLDPALMELQVRSLPREEW